MKQVDFILNTHKKQFWQRRKTKRYSLINIFKLNDCTILTWCAWASQSTYNDEETHKLRVRPLPSFACNDVPFLWRAHNDLSGVDLLFAELVISSQLRHCNAITSQTLWKTCNSTKSVAGLAKRNKVEKDIWCSYLPKTAHHFLHQGTHRSNVDDFEVVQVDRAVHVDMLANLPKHGHQGNISFTSSLCTADKTAVQLNQETNR